MKLPQLPRWFLICCCFTIASPVWSQDKVSVAYGTSFSGSDGNIFASSDGAGFNGDNNATIALGYFSSGFDVLATAEAKDFTGLIASFNALHSTDFSSVAANAYLTQDRWYV